MWRRWREIAAAEGAGVVVNCGKSEAEIAELDGDEKLAFLQEWGCRSQVWIV